MNIPFTSAVDFKGNILEVNESSNPDLLWALRGAGNANFGIVVELSFNIYPIEGNVTYFRIDYNSTYSKTVLNFWQQWAPTVDNSLSSQTNIYHNSILTNGLFWGTVSELQVLLEPLLAISPYNTFQIFSMDYLDSVLFLGGCPNISYCLDLVNNVPDPNKPTYFKAKSSYVKSLSDAGLNELLYFMGPGFRNCCRGFTGLIIDAYGGKINEISANQTAFAHRNMSYHIQVFLEVSSKIILSI